MRRVGAAFVLLLAALAGSSARATPMTYTLDGVTATFPLSAVYPAGTADISGSFTYDPATQTVSSASITSSGYPDFSGVYAFNPFVESGGSVLGVANGPFGLTDEIFLTFAAPLGSTPDAVVGLEFHGPAGLTIPTDVADSTTGFADPAIPSVPEPASALLLCGSLIALGAARLGVRTAA